MRRALLIASSLVLTAAPAAAQTPSQHARVGQLATLRFGVGSAQLPSKDRLTPVLGPVAAWAAEHPDGLVVLDGHADRSGSPAINVRLSMQRAQAVRAQLVALGLDADRIVIAAYGDDAPTRRGAAEDRRVVVWGTRAGMRAIAARTMARGHAVLWSGLMTPLDLEPQPGAVATR